MKDDWFEKHRSELGDLRKSLTIKECFVCKAKPVDSHSIPKQNVLDRIKTQNAQGNFVIYSFDNELKFDYQSKKYDYAHRNLELVETGKGMASVFWGFCSEHEKLFFPVEGDVLFNNQVEHKFLHAYRAFAYSLNRLKGALTFYSNDNVIRKYLSQTGEQLGNIGNETDWNKVNTILNGLTQEQVDQIESLLRVQTPRENKYINESLGSSIDEGFQKYLSNFKVKSVADIKAVLNQNMFSSAKDMMEEAASTLSSLKGEIDFSPILLIEHKLNSAVGSKAYNIMEHEVIFLDYIVPLACALTFKIGSVSDNISLTVLPDFKQGKTIILFSFFHGDAIANEYVLSVINTDSNRQLEIISDIILTRSSNTYISPDYFEQFPESLKKNIFKLLNDPATNEIESYGLNLFRN